jgi:hypothetical protein
VSLVFVLAVSSCGNATQVSNSGDAAAAAATPTRASWNPNVDCRATVTQLSKVLGTERSSLGGATFNGGGFKPGIPDRRALRPPCTVNGGTTFVQLNNVRVSSCDKINDDGDWTCTLYDPNAPEGTPADLNRIHIETDQKFRSRAGWSKPPGGTNINVQGFVFWDPNHVTAKWHNHSGWEIHSFTAWRRVA